MNLEQRLVELRIDPPAYTTDAVLLGTGLADGFSTFDSPIGTVVVTFNPVGVSSVDLADDGFEQRFTEKFDRALSEANPPRVWRDGIKRGLDAGRPGKLPIDFRSVSKFQRTVLETASDIPRGQVRPYGWLAARVGNPGATRAVGSTMARNPVPLIVPCHRVVRADGSIGAYSLGGPHNKLALLTAEGADLEALESMTARGVRYIGSDTSSTFCFPTCRHARRIGKRHRVEFHSTLEAHTAGFRACMVCEPETT